MDLTAPPRRAPRGGSASRKAAVLGSPVSHSRSPDLHLAAYRALDLHDWTYERIECDERRLPTLVGELPAEWVGLSVTMPGKRVALDVADERTERAVLVGSANTLVRVENGWRADCTDIDGMIGALRQLDIEVAGSALVRENYSGRAKLVVDRERNVLVGATFVGPDIAELVHSATIAVVGGVSIDRLWHAVPSYPTVSEVWLRLLENLRG